MTFASDDILSEKNVCCRNRLKRSIHFTVQNFFEPKKIVKMTTTKIAEYVASKASWSGVAIVISFVASAIVTGVSAMAAKEAAVVSDTASKQAEEGATPADTKLMDSVKSAMNKTTAVAVLSGVTTIVLGIFVVKGLMKPKSASYTF